MGGRGGIGGGMGRRGRGRHANSEEPQVSALELRLSDNDTNAYMKAEEALAESQRAKAREIASAYRQQLWDSRHGK